MFIAHLPAGYLWTKAYLKQSDALALTSVMRRRLIGLGLVASVLPDLDVVYFYLWDGRQHHHHSYVSHLPIWWFVAWGLVTILSKIFQFSLPLRTAFNVVFSNGILHLVLDTVAGDIRWLYPFAMDYISLFSPPAVHEWWILNFILHWTFLIEIAVCLAALNAYRQR